MSGVAMPLGGGGIRQLTGDVTAGPGSGSQAATVNYSPTVILAPAASTRNVVQPTGDFKPLIVKRFNAGAVSNLFEAQDENGNALAAVGSSGVGTHTVRDAGTNAVTNVLILDHLTSGSPAAGFGTGLQFQGKSSVQDRPMARIRSIWADATDATRSTNLILSTFDTSEKDILELTSATVVLKITDTSAGLTNVLHIDHLTTATPVNGYGTAVKLRGHSSTNTLRDMARIRSTWTTATDASRKARLTISAYDTAERDCIMIEASGAAAMVGFFGTAPIVKPTATGSRGSNAALASLITQLANLGLIVDGTTA